MSTLAWPFKDPEEILDYQVDWTERLASDTIDGSVWAISVGDGDLIVEAESFTDTHTVIWFSGGTLGTTYQITNHITTAGSRQMEQTVKLRIKSK